MKRTEPKADCADCTHPLASFIESVDVQDFPAKSTPFQEVDMYEFGKFTHVIAVFSLYQPH